MSALLAAIIAMGMLNAAVEEVNDLPVGVTYVTGALSRFENIRPRHAETDFADPAIKLYHCARFADRVRHEVRHCPFLRCPCALLAPRSAVRSGGAGRWP